MRFHSVSSSSNPTKESVDEVARLALPQCPRLTQLGLVALAKFELGDRHRTILAIPSVLSSCAKRLRKIASDAWIGVDLFSMS